MKKNRKNKKNKNIFIAICITLVFLALTLASFMKIDPDYFWHIKAGEYMLKHGPINHDVFSWYVNSKYWMSHEWLFEVILASLKCVFGKAHVFIYIFSCLLGLLFFLFLSNKESYMKNIPYTMFYMLFFFLTGIGFTQARPYLISFILLAITIYFLIDLYKNEDSKKIYFLPLITIIWANVHGGSSNLPYLLCLVFIIGGLFSFKFEKIEAEKLSKLQLKKYLITMILCMVAVCINIHGFKMFLYPYLNMMDTTMLQNISEWRSTSLNESYHYMYFAFLLFIIITMLLSRKKIRFIDFLLLGFVAYLGLKSIRFWFYTYIVMSYVVFDYVDELEVDKGTIPCLLAICLTLFISFLFDFDRVIKPTYKLNLDKEVVNTIKKLKPKRLFNMYDYGGELIYNDIKVFIDGRADLYTNYNYKDYLDISNLNKDTKKLINKYNFDYLLVNNNYPIQVYLQANSNYDLVYNKGNIYIYKKIVN